MLLTVQITVKFGIDLGEIVLDNWQCRGRQTEAQLFGFGGQQDPRYSEMIAMIAQHNEEIEQQGATVVAHERPRMIETEKDDVQHEGYVNRPIELNTVDHHVRYQHHCYVAPAGDEN